MSQHSPEDTVRAFFEAFNRGQLDALLEFYEHGAVLMVEPDLAVAGHEAVREALKDFLSLKPVLTLGNHHVVTTDDIALSIAQWNLKGTDFGGKAVELSGTTSDVLRRQEDGRWLFVIDNPWGEGLVG